MSEFVVEKLDQVKAEAKAKADVEAQAKADAETEAELKFANYLDENDFVAFVGKGGKIAKLLHSKLDRAASAEANEVFGLVQCQAQGCSFPSEKFTSRLKNLEVGGENRYLIEVYLNLPKGKSVKLKKFGDYEVKYYFTK